MQAVKRVNVAVLGCGEVAQITHLPNLLYDSNRWRISALCDVSPGALQLCGEKFGVGQGARFSSLSTMLSSGIPIDVVFVLSHDLFHTDHVLACAAAGKHVFVEKPMAQTLEECDAIAAAQKQNETVIFVGYMRRYSDVFKEFKAALQGKTIKYARVRELVPKNTCFSSQASMYHARFNDTPSTDLDGQHQRNLAKNFGDRAGRDEYLSQNWKFLTSLGSHDLSAMRDALGMPERCEYAGRSHESDGQSSLWYNAIFAYPGFKVNYELGMDTVPNCDVHIEVYTHDSRVQIKFDTSYIRGLPITLTIQTRSPTDGLTTVVQRPTYKSYYASEMEELHAAITENKPYCTTPEDARQDTVLIRMMLRKIMELEQGADRASEDASTLS